jgi:hypothetical protein
MSAPKIRVSLDQGEAALLLEALEELGTASREYETLKATTQLAARIRTSARVWGADWLHDHP